MQQYKTPFTCPECREHYFQTDAVLGSGMDFVDAECTNCGYPLTAADLASQLPGIPEAAVQQVIAQYRP